MVDVLMGGITCETAEEAAVVTHARKLRRLRQGGSRAAARHRYSRKVPGAAATFQLVGCDSGAERGIGGAVPGLVGWLRRGWRHVPRELLPAWVLAVGVLGAFAVLGVAGPHSGEITAAGPVPVPVVGPAPVQGAGGKTIPGTVRRRAYPRRTTAAVAARRKRRRSGPVPGAARASAAARRPRPPVSQPGTAAPVLVRYVVTTEAGAVFQGEVEVVNYGKEPLTGWQITVGLEGDTVTGVQGAAALVINGILLVQPAASTQTVPPDGGTLRVFFTASGPRTVPLVCTFNEITCQ